MSGKTEYAEGLWCADCEFFEVPDILDGQCIACGCPASEHRDVVVVDR